MTPTSGCRDVERLILESEGRKLDPSEKALVEGHLGSCGRCRGFAADREIIRESAAALGWPALPPGLDRKTRQLVLAGPPGRRPATVPAWLLAALAVVTIITGIGLAVSLADVTPETRLADLSPAGLAAVFIIIQNALTLLFAPVVLRTFRARRSASGSV
jgi:predicted anti-sigma-YlaC factor YlaD